MLEKIKGIILKTQDYGETHKIVTIFSPQTGKISAIARGAKKTKSRMAAVTQPFIYGDFLIFVGRGLSTLRQGEIINSFRSIREDIVKTAYTSYISELTERLIDDRHPDVFLFQEFYNTIEWIEKNDDIDIPIMMYEMKVFMKGGFAPVVKKCVNCGTKELPFSFSIKEGGMLCKSCLNMDEYAKPLNNSLVKLFNILQSLKLSQVGKITVKESNKQLMRQILDAYYDQYGSYYLKTKKFLKQLDLLK